MPLTWMSGLGFCVLTGVSEHLGECRTYVNMRLRMRVPACNVGMCVGLDVLLAKVGDNDTTLTFL